jgi:hypothetical protein
VSHSRTLSIQTELRELDELRHARHFDSIIDGFEMRMTIRFFVYFMSQGVLTAAMILWIVGILR